MDSTPNYRALVLRAWEIQPATQETPAVWRYAVNDPATAQWHRFEKLDQLMLFIRGELQNPQDRSGVKADELDQGRLLSGIEHTV